MAGIALLALLMAGASWAVKRWFAEKVYPTYVHPLDPMDERTRELFELMGADLVGFEYCVPKDRTVSITLVARNEKGVIRELSREYLLCEGPGPREVHFIRLDPDRMSESRKNRVRWIMRIGTGTYSAWSDNPVPPSISSAVSQTPVPRLDAIQLGKTYKVWGYNASGRTARESESPGQRSYRFSLELRFKVTESKFGPNSIPFIERSYNEAAGKNEQSPPDDDQPQPDGVIP